MAVVRKSDGKELQKQGVVIGDETGSCRLVLWEEDVGSLEEGKSYHLLDVVVRMYMEQQSIFLTLPEVRRHWRRI